MRRSGQPYDATQGNTFARLRKGKGKFKGKGQKGAMKRGQHRNRNCQHLGAGNSQGQGMHNRQMKRFGEGFVDSDGDGVCDNYQKQTGNKR